MTEISPTKTLPSSAFQPRRLAELYQLFAIGLPMVGLQMAQMGMGVMDVIMSGRLSTLDLAGIALGTSLMWPIMIMFWGILMALTPIVSQLRGERTPQAAGAAFQQAAWIALAGSLITMLLFYNAEPVLILTEADPESVRIANSYLQNIAWGIPGLMGYFVIRYMVEGMGYTKPAFIVALGALTLKLPLNYIFMYGEFGLPAMGSAGCGLASAIIMWFEFVAMIWVASRPGIRVTGWYRNVSGPNWLQIKKILKLGLPIGLTNFLEIGFFSLVTLLISRLGATVIGAHQIAMNIAAVAFMLPMALGQAASIRISFHVGGGALKWAKMTSEIVLMLAPLSGLLIGALIVLLRSPLVDLYTTDPAMLAMASKLLIFVGAFQVFDVMQAMVIGALRGYKTTQFAMMVNLGAYWFLTLPLGYYLTYALDNPMGVYGFWAAIIAGLVIVAVLVSFRLWSLSSNDQQILMLKNRV